MRRIDRSRSSRCWPSQFGIGSNIAVFTVVNALLFRSLPYPDGDRLVQVGRSLNEGPSYTMSYARFRFVEQNNRAFESVAA